MIIDSYIVFNIREPQLGDVSFTPSTGIVNHYDARVYAEGTTTPIVATQHLGLPSASPLTGLITVNLATTLNALSAGNYEVIIAAFGPTGSVTESAHLSAVAVPLQAP